MMEVRRWLCGTILAVVALSGPEADAASGKPYRIDVTPTNDVAEVFARVGKVGDDLRKDGIEVVFAPGEYRFGREARLETGHSGRVGAETVFRAEKPGTVRFIGGATLDNAAFVPVPEGRVRNRLKPSVRDRVRVCDIAPYVKGELKPWPDATKNPPGPWLYIDDEPASLARFPDADWIRFGKAARTGFENAEKDKVTGRRKVGPGALYWEGDAAQAKAWDLSDGAWLYGYWTHDWYEEFLRADSLTETPTNLVLNLRGVHQYGIKGNWTSGAKKRRYFVLNLPEELDAPGEFWIDRKEKKLYLLPPEGFEKRALRLAVLARPFLQTSYKEDVHDIRFENLTFTAAHSVEFAVVLNASRIAFENCTFSNLGGSGLNLSGRGNRVENCRIRNLGGMGVMLCGGKAETLEPAGNAVIDCDISQYARFCRTYAPAVRCYGVGQAVVGCRIHDAPHQAICYGGQCHRFERNEIYRVLTETADSGAIYMGRNTSHLGTVIAHNRFHDLATDDAELRRHTYAVYFDDCGWGGEVRSNRFERLGYGVLIGGGNLHRVEGNVFEDCYCGVTCGSRGRTWAKINGMFRPDPKTGVSWFEGFLLPYDYRRGIWHERFPELEGLIADRPDLPRVNPIVGNAFVGCEKPLDFDALARTVTNEMPVVGNVICRGLLCGDGVHDDTAAIQERLDAGRPCVYLPPPANHYVISTSLVMRSGTELKLDRFTRVRLAPHSDVPMVVNGGWADGDRDIAVTGGIWDYDNANQGPNMMMTDPKRCPKSFERSFHLGCIFRFENVKGLCVRGVTFRNPVTFGCQLTKTSLFSIEDITFDYRTWNPVPLNMDGIHLDGGNHHGRIANLRGTCYDDMVALNASDGFCSAFEGPITDIDIDGLQAEYSHRGVRILSTSASAPVERVTIRNVHLKTYRNAVAITHFFPDRPTRGVFNAIAVRGVFASAAPEPQAKGLNPSGFAWPLVWVQAGCDVGELVVDHVSRQETFSAKAPTVGVDKGAKVGRLVLRDCHQTNGTSGDLKLFDLKGEIGELVR